jgi:predicted nucleic acid-binding protein
LIAAADAADVFHQPSRDLLRKIVTEGIAVIQPSFARIEVACALARRLRNSAQGSQLTQTLMDRIVTTEQPLTQSFLATAEALGTRQFLRGADALYAAVAELSQSPLVSWDKEHLQRAGGITPASWLAANP